MKTDTLSCPYLVVYLLVICSALTPAFSQNNSANPSQEKNTRHGLSGARNRVEKGNSSHEEIFLESLRFMQGKAQEVIDNVLKQALPMMVKVNSEVVLSTNCTRAILKVVTGLRTFQEWAVKMVDASGKVPEGILHGSLSSFGAYDQCIEIEDGSPEVIRGQYCAAEVRPILPPKSRRYTMGNAFQEYPQAKKVLQDMKLDSTLGYFYFMKFRLGLCLPSSCLKSDLDRIAIQVSREVKANVTVVWCEKKEAFQFERIQIIAGSVVGVFVLLAVIGTSLDLVPRFFGWLLERKVSCLRKNGVTLEVLQAFSVYTNIPKLLSTRVREDRLSALHGMKVITITWVMLGNTYLCRNESQLTGMRNADSLGSDWAFQVVLNGSFAAETFLFISGFLVIYWSWKKLDEKRGRFSFLQFYLHRYWRLTPAFILVSVLVMTGSLSGFGPIWHETVKPFVLGCRKHWWTNLIYIRNFMPTEESCLPHGWYMACDMQFYLLAPIILLTLYKRPLIGKFLVAGGICVCTVIVAVIVWVLELPPTPLYSNPDPEVITEYMDTIATKPYTHFPAYLLGLITAYIVIQKEKIRIRPVFQLMGWIFFSSLALTVVYGTLHWNKGHLPGTVSSVLYAASSRPAWTLGVAWVVLLCTTGQGGLVDRFLSWKLFVPLSRLTYMTFIIHPIIMYIFVSYLRNPIFFTQYVLVYLFFANVFVTFGIAFAFCLVLEMPFIALEKIFLEHLGKWKLLHQRIREPKRSLEYKRSDLKAAPSLWISRDESKSPYE